MKTRETEPARPDEGPPEADTPGPLWREFFKSLKGGASRRTYSAGAVIYRQGDPADAIFFVETGRVQLGVVSGHGREGIIAMLGPGEFFGEGALGGLERHRTSAAAMEEATIIRIDRDMMLRALREQASVSGSFLDFVLARNIQIQADLVDHLFNSSERRLARVLLLMAGRGGHESGGPVIPRLKQEVLAARVGTTRARVSYFMNKFRRLGLLEDRDDGIKIHAARLHEMVRDDGPHRRNDAATGSGRPFRGDRPQSS